MARVGELTVELRPKIGIAPVLFLVSYALDPKSWKARTGGTRTRRQSRRSRYPAVRPHRAAGDPTRIAARLRRREDTLTSVRGRVRIAEQFRTRTGLPLPIEVVYDDFTPDILENRLLRTAVDILGRLYLRHRDSHTALAMLRQQLNGISSMAPDSRGVPEPHWTRLNERYRPAVALARLEARAGGEDASVFLIDMNAVFEGFIRVALREALRAGRPRIPARRSWPIGTSRHRTRGSARTGFVLVDRRPLCIRWRLQVQKNRRQHT